MTPSEYQKYRTDNASYANEAWQNLVENNPSYKNALLNMSVVSTKAYDLLYLPGHTIENPNLNTSSEEFIADMGAIGAPILSIRNALSQSKDNQNTAAYFKSMNGAQKTNLLNQLEIIEQGFSGQGPWGDILIQLAQDDSRTKDYQDVKGFINAIKLGINGSNTIQNQESKYNSIMLDGSDPFISNTLLSSKKAKESFNKNRKGRYYDNIINNAFVDLSSTEGRSGSVPLGMEKLRELPWETKEFPGEWSKSELKTWDSFKNKALRKASKLMMTDRSLYDARLDQQEFITLLLRKADIAIS